MKKIIKVAHLVCECNKEYNYSNKFVMGDTIMSAVEEWAKRDYENIIGMIQNSLISLVTISAY